MVKITTQYVPERVVNAKTYGRGGQKLGIVVHQTGNLAVGANAQMHANLQSRMNPRQASWHFQVDDTIAIQSFGASVECWHAGVGRRYGNLDTIAVEICINRDGNYNKAVENGAKIVSWLMELYNIPISRVHQHNNFDGKNCPAQIRANKNGINWSNFINMVQGNDTSVNDDPEESTNIDDLVERTLSGEFGNGDVRKQRLGDSYNEVQSKINSMYDVKNETTLPDIDDLVERTILGEFGNGEERKRKLGEYYEAVQTIVNQRFNTPDSSDVSIPDLIKQTIQGEFGNGEERKKALGSYYDEVQAGVNRLYS